MKIAYIGHDRTCLKSSFYFTSHGHEVQYFLKNEGVRIESLSFNKIDILVDGLMIPAEEKRRTDQHNYKYLNIKSSHRELNALLALPKFSSTENDPVVDLQQNVSVFNLEIVKDLQIDPKQRKVFLELAKKGVETFDYVLIEGHPFISDQLDSKKINISKDKSTMQYVWSALRFDIEFLQPLRPFATARSFFMVQDSSRKSLLDNWLLCQVIDNQIHIWTWLPIHQSTNLEFQIFYTERLKVIISKKLDFLLVKKFHDFYFSTVGASYENRTSSRGPVLIVPNFTYSSLPEVKNYFDSVLTKKLKVLQHSAEANP